MKSVIGRIQFYLDLEDYEEMKRNQVVEVRISENVIIQMRLKPQPTEWQTVTNQIIHNTGRKI